MDTASRKVVSSFSTIISSWPNVSVVNVFVLCLQWRADALSAFIDLISSFSWFDSCETKKSAMLLDDSAFEWILTGGTSILGSLGGGIREQEELVEEWS